MPVRLRPRPGEPAPEISLTADDGAWFRSADRRDREALVVGFAPLPGLRSSRALLSALEEARAELADRAAVVAVCLPRPEALAPRRAALGLGYPLLHDLLGAVALAYGLPLRIGAAAIAVDGRLLALAAGRDPGPALASLPRAAGAPQDGRISWSEAEGRVAAGALLVDVRTPAEFAAWRHPAAVNVPWDELPRRLGELRGRELVIACAAGDAAPRAVAWLASAGLPGARPVRGGLAAWRG